MKYLKIRVRADEKGKMLYPQGFTSFQCLEHIYCDDAGVCNLVVAIDDKNLVKITDMTDVKELTLTEAEVYLDKFDLRTTEITDEGMVRALEIKSNLGTPLSATELKAIDPNDPTPGIEYRKRFIDKVNDRKIGEISHL